MSYPLCVNKMLNTQGIVIVQLVLYSLYKYPWPTNLQLSLAVKHLPIAIQTVHVCLRDSAHTHSLAGSPQSYPHAHCHLLHRLLFTIHFSINNYVTLQTIPYHHTGRSTIDEILQGSSLSLAMITVMINFVEVASHKRTHLQTSSGMFIRY